VVKLPKNLRLWKISPGRGGKYWKDWLMNGYCILYGWPEKSYFNETNMNLLKKYSDPMSFLKKTGYRGGLKNDWRYQLKNFVWDVKEGETVFAYKRGTFVGHGKFGNYYNDDNGNHLRKIKWNELSPPLSLKGTDVIKILSQPCTIKNIDDYRDEIRYLLQKRGLDNILNCT